ncbi:type II toxin-antitoxin system prevent-host-death family antitoxin [Mesorhizobium sp. M0166]|uniref:type II toxin-antitoxin system Phd/YefM family antitoxin n=1 Tax=Mesorhizobium sp. M0166 TaxID=2956902 RepID=UPI00333B7B8F
MTIKVKVGEAKTHLSELLSKLEAGEEATISGGNDPIANLSRIQRRNGVEAAIEEISAARVRAKPVTQDEIRAWRDEGSRA